MKSIAAAIKDNKPKSVSRKKRKTDKVNEPISDHEEEQDLFVPTRPPEKQEICLAELSRKNTEIVPNGVHPKDSNESD